MKYALLIYSALAAGDEASPESREIPAGIAAVLARPEVTGWLRLQSVESATTVRRESARTVLSDGPFVDSKEFLGGIVVVEAANLDRALAVAADLEGARPGVTIEVRPVLEEDARSA